MNLTEYIEQRKARSPEFAAELERLEPEYFIRRMVLNPTLRHLFHTQLDYERWLLQWRVYLAMRGAQ